jgi:hypothetical protein
MMFICFFAIAALAAKSTSDTLAELRTRAHRIGDAQPVIKDPLAMLNNRFEAAYLRTAETDIVNLCRSECEARGFVYNIKDDECERPRKP